MARTLSAVASTQISNKDIKATRVFTINGVDRTSYLKTSSRSFDKTYGAAQASFTLHNPNGIFSPSGIYEVNVGDVVSLQYKFTNDTIAYDCFYGVVNQRGMTKNAQVNEITLNCLDYISMLQQWDLDMLIEGTKEKIENETLSPNLLPSPNDMYSQVFNFANDSIATNPPPVLVIRDRLHSLNDPQYDGMEIYYASGQVKFGFPLNVRDNYDVVARNYHFYTEGVFVEDALEQILTAPNGYGKYLFNETSAQAVIDNHLTDTFQNVSGLTYDTLIPNYSDSTVTLKAYLTEDYNGTPPFIHYKMNDNDSSVTITDSQGNYNGSLKDGTENLFSNIVSSASGKVNRAIQLNGDDYYIDCGDVEEINDARYLSIVFWHAPKHFGGSGVDNETYFLKTNGDGSSKLKIHATTDDELIIELSSQSKSYTAILESYSSFVTVDTFSHFKLLFDFTEEENENKIKLFIDNVQMTLVFSGTYTPKRIPNLTGFNLYIGYSSNSMNGLIDDVRMYDFILPDMFYDEIYNSGSGTEDEISTTVLAVDSTEGFPSSGEAEINGDIFTYTSIDSTHLYGIPITGENSLNNHVTGSVVKASVTKGTGEVWYLKYSNLITDLTTSDFDLPSGITVSKVDKRNGRIYLSSAVSIAENIRCTTNYSFKTLQSSGIEINRIQFTPRETENRFEAINKLRAYVAPNYVIRTQGDEKIWSSFLSQRTVEDFNLSLISNLNYLEDTDLYTRVIMYAKNSNPTNVMFEDGVDFVTTNEEYKGYASLSELSYIGEEGVSPVIPEGASETYAQWIRDMAMSSSTATGYYLFATGIPNAGYITVNNTQPIVYIDNVAIDNKKHQMIMQPVRWLRTTRTVTKTTSTKKGTEVDVQVYYQYKIYFAHHSIESYHDIILYDAFGDEVMRITAGDGNMDWAGGIYNVPGQSENSTVESISTATYWVFYAAGNLVIDYDNAIFKIHKSILPFPVESSVRATFEYIHTMTPIQGIASVIDGRWDTQVQTEFYAEPPQGYNYGIIDLGQVQNIQAIDIVAGFFKPDEVLKFDTDIHFSLHYSLDGVDYYNISDKTSYVHLASGDSVSFEEDALGEDLRARYLKLVIENVKKIEYKKGVYPVAFTEFSAYANIILKSEAKLIPTTYLTQDTIPQSGSQTIYVNSTKGFEDPESGETATAFIDGDEFTYTGLTDSEFLGCVGLTEEHARTDYVYQYEPNDTDLLDYDGLLQKLGDRLYKKVDISDELLFTQEQNDRLARAYLNEFYKNHSKAQVEVMFSPHLLVGDTVRVVDSVNGIDDLYFLESISDNSNGATMSLVLAKYPS